MSRTTRRRFFSTGAVGAAGLATSACSRPAPAPAPPRATLRSTTILLRSGWQTVNIGDIAHTPGVLRLLGQYLNEAEVILWSNAVDRGVDAMLLRHFPGLRIVQGGIGEDGLPDSPPLREAFEQADFLLHGSGPGVVARHHLEAWHNSTGKPYGIFGVTIALEQEAASPAIDPQFKELLENSEFVFTRETTSFDNVIQAGVRGTRVAFAPDGTFNLQILNEDAARAFLEKYELESKRYLVVIPRLRYTPYHKIREVNWPEERIRRRTAVNARHAESDHAKLREVIIRWVRETGHKVLLCAEMTYALDIIDPLLYLPLPEDVRAKVVRQPHYWLTDTAASVYRRAVAVVSFECHSPIIAAVNDTPCVYVHQPEDGIKGQMWRDIGLTRWYIEVEATSGQAIANQVMGIYSNYASAQVQVHEAVIYARSLQAEGMNVLRKLLLRPAPQA